MPHAPPGCRTDDGVGLPGRKVQFLANLSYCFPWPNHYYAFRSEIGLGSIRRLRRIPNNGNARDAAQGLLPHNSRTRLRPQERRSFLTTESPSASRHGLDVTPKSGWLPFASAGKNRPSPHLSRLHNRGGRHPTTGDVSIQPNSSRTPGSLPGPADQSRPQPAVRSCCGSGSAVFAGIPPETAKSGLRHPAHEGVWVRRHTRQALMIFSESTPA